MTRMTLVAFATFALVSSAHLRADDAPGITVTTPAPAAAAKPTGPQPKMVIDNITYDAGDVSKGEVITHDFKVKNTGKGDLMILAVKPACGCTAPDWTKLIAPGGEGVITLKVETARFKGPISKTAQVTTNDTEQASVRLTVNANVKTFIDVLPSDSVAFRQFRGEDKREEVTIKSNETGAFDIKDVQVTGEGIKHELKKAAGDPSSYKLAIWMDDNAPIGNIAGTIKLLTNSAKEPEVTVKVTGSVLGQITVNPGTLYFRIDGAGGPGGAAGASAFTANTDNLNIREKGEMGASVVAKVAKGSKLTLVEDAGEWAKVRTESGSEGWAFKKLITAAPSAAAPAAAGKQEMTKQLNLTHREENSGLSITSATVTGTKLDTGVVKVSVEPVKAGQSYQLTVTYGGGLEKGNYTGNVVIKTNSKEQPEVTVPLYIVVA